MDYQVGGPTRALKPFRLCSGGGRDVVWLDVHYRLCGGMGPGVMDNLSQI